MTRLRTAMAACLLGTSLTHCGLALNPNEGISLSGYARDERGEPLANTQLTLSRSETKTCDVVAPFTNLTTDKLGYYRHALVYDQTYKNTEDTPRCFRVSLSMGEDGARSSVDFQIFANSISVPDLQQWSGSLAELDQTSGMQLSFSDLNETRSVAGIEHTVQIGSGSGTAWLVNDATSPVQLSNAMFEDFGDLTLSASATTTRGEFTLGYWSDTLLLERDPGPASLIRGEPCTYSGSPATCTLTDGKLEGAALNKPDAVTVTFATPRTLSRVLLRGFSFSGSGMLQGQVNGTWTQLSTFEATQANVPRYLDVPVANAAYQALRLEKKAVGGSFAITRLDEVSAF